MLRDTDDHTYSSDLTMPSGACWSRSCPRRRDADDISDDQIDWSNYLPPPGFHALPRRWVVERTTRLDDLLKGPS